MSTFARRLVDPPDLALLEQPPPLPLGGGERADDLDGQGIGADVRPVLGGHHPHQRVREEVHQLERALAGQGVDLEVAEPPLAERADQLVERVAAGQAHARPVGRDLLEVAGGRRPEILLQLARLAQRDHDRVSEPEALHQSRLQARPLRQLDLDTHQPLGERPLQEARHLGGGEAQLAGDLVLVPLGAVVELHAPDHLPDLVRLSPALSPHSRLLQELSACEWGALTSPDRSG